MQQLMPNPLFSIMLSGNGTTAATIGVEVYLDDHPLSDFSYIKDYDDDDGRRRARSIRSRSFSDTPKLKVSFNW